jgi:hypothetical protein
LVLGPVGPFGFLLQTIPLFTSAAVLPDNALGTKLTITARFRARLAVVETIPAVTDLHLLAGYIGLSIRMESTVRHETPRA